MVWANHHFVPAIPVCLGAYLLGCVATGYYLVQFTARRDIRAGGSGNVGARNAGRLLGAWGFVTVLVCDLGKGALAVWLTRHFTGDQHLALLGLLAATAGHIWPVQLRFRGGKGVSTSLGGLLALDWRVALTFAAVAGVSALLLRRFTLGGLIAFAALPLMAMAWHEDPMSVGGFLILAALVLVAHRKNLAAEMKPSRLEEKS